MSISKEGEVLSPVEFKIRDLEAKASELKTMLYLLLDTLGLTVVRSVRDPSTFMILSNTKEASKDVEEKNSDKAGSK